jgi:hypothetical protein
VRVGKSVRRVHGVVAGETQVRVIVVTEHVRWTGTNHTHGGHSSFHFDRRQLLVVQGPNGWQDDVMEKQVQKLCMIIRRLNMRWCTLLRTRCIKSSGMHVSSCRRGHAVLFRESLVPRRRQRAPCQAPANPKTTNRSNRSTLIRRLYDRQFQGDAKLFDAVADARGP